MIVMGSRGIYDLMRRTVFDDFKGALNSNHAYDASL